MKLRQKIIFHVAHFHINRSLSTKNMFKGIKVIKSRGALGTESIYAAVLLFELYLAQTIALRVTLARLAMVLVWQTRGKPLTRFPCGGLVVWKRAWRRPEARTFLSRLKPPSRHWLSSRQDFQKPNYRPERGRKALVDSKKTTASVWQRAVNRQPGSRSDNSLSKRLPQKKIYNFKKIKFLKF